MEISKFHAPNVQHTKQITFWPHRKIWIWCTCNKNSVLLTA